MGEEVNVAAAEATVATTSNTKQPVPLHFVLVHGISGGAWCWYKIRCLMENSGYKVSCIDLKSAGIDPSDPNSVLSFDDYNQPLMDFLSSLPENEQVILVGHSAGGLSVTQACHKFGKRIRLAVYVAATMLKLGLWTDQDIKQGVPDFSEFGDDVSDLVFALGSDQSPTSAIVKKELQRKIIYPMCPQEDAILASMLLKPGPIRAALSARFTETEGGGDDGIEGVPRVYIRTEYDNVVKPEQQEAMIKRWPPKKLDNLIFMNSRSTVAFTVSCKSGNKNDLFFWILVCLLPSFLVTPIACVNFLLFKVIVRCPSSSFRNVDSSGEIHL